MSTARKPLPRSDHLTPIGVVHSPFRQKFGIPRQPGLVPEARGEIELLQPFSQAEAFKGIEAYSHLWLIYRFHAIPEHGWKATVRPPRLGGRQRLGVFATRSPFRPNPLGLSTVRLEQVIDNEGEIRLEVSGLDLLDGTPLYDIKPYIPYTDSHPGAEAGFAQQQPERRFKVCFSEPARSACERIEARRPGFERLITEVLAGDPRPAYKDRGEDARIYGMQLYDYNVRWSVAGDTARVEEIIDLK